MGLLDRKTKEHGEGRGTLGALLAGHPGGVAPITAEDAWARRCPDGAADNMGDAGNATVTATVASLLDVSSADSGAALGLKTEVKHALHAIESKLENVLTGHHHSGHAATAHVAAHATPPIRSSAGVAWTNVTVASEGKEVVSLLTARHAQELARQSAIQWQQYKPFEHHQKGMATMEVRYDGTPCFGGCASLTRDNPAFQLTGRAAELAGRHPPGSLSLVLPWCCEWVSFILQQIDFKGLLKEIYLYDKCSHTVR